jgi:hypothetical protein
VGHRSQPDAGPDRPLPGPAPSTAQRCDGAGGGPGSGLGHMGRGRVRKALQAPTTWRWPRTWQSVRRCPSTTPSLHGWTLAAAVELQHAVLPVIAHAALRKGSSLAARLSRIVHQCVRLTRSYNRATPQPP